MKMPSREWSGALTISVIAVVLAALDIFDGSVHRWWVEHAFTTSLVGGIMVLLVTVLVADRVIHARQLRDRSRAIAAQAAIVMTQAARTSQTAIAVLEGTGDHESASDELRSYGTMLLIAAPLLIEEALSRAFLTPPRAASAWDSSRDVLVRTRPAADAGEGAARRQTCDLDRRALPRADGEAVVLPDVAGVRDEDRHLGPDREPAAGEVLGQEEVVGGQLSAGRLGGQILGRSTGKSSERNGQPLPWQPRTTSLPS